MAAQFLENSRIFLTGGTGFFGKCLLERFAELNAKSAGLCEVVVLSRDAQRFLRLAPSFAACPWLSFAEGDIRDFRFPPGPFTHVIHAAADSSDAAAADATARFDQIVMGTRRTLDFALAVGATNFLFTSSGAIYGPQPGDLACMPETYLGAPETCNMASTYGQAKRAAEQLCTNYHGQYGLQTKIARCFAFVSEHMPLDGHFAIGNFIRDALQGDAISVKGDGSPVRSYMYGADLAHWLLTLLDQGKPAHPYNVGSDQAISIADLAHLVGSLLAPAKPVVIERARADFNGRSRYVPDISRAREELGLGLSTNLPEAIRLAALSKPVSSRS